MSEKDSVFKGKLKQTGIFSFKDLYSFIYDWLRDEGYDVFERNYKEKVSGDSKEIEIKWEAQREISDYFRFLITIDWMIIGMKSVEVQKETKKVKMESGALEIKFKGVIVKDYENRWEDSPIWKFFRGIYEKYIIKSRIDDYEIKLITEIEELVNQCKAFLAIEAQH